MKTLPPILLILFFLNEANAQQYLIKYDVAGENVKYIRVKKPGDTVQVSVIDLTKSKNVNLRLENLPGSYTRKIILNEEEETPETISFPGFGSAPVGGLVKGMLSFDINKMKPDVLFKDLFKQSEKINKSNDNKSNDFESEMRFVAMQKFTSQYIQFINAYANWKKALLFEEDCNYLWKDLLSLRYSLQTTATEVKQTATQKTKEVLPEIIENPSAVILKTPGNQSALATSTEQSFSTLNSTYASFSGLGISSKEADSVMNEAATYMATVNQFKQNTGNTSSEVAVKRIADLYRQIMTDRYVQTIPLTVNRNTKSVEIRFTPNINPDDSLNASAIGLNKNDSSVVRYVTIYKKSPMRLRNTFGFSFVSFAESRWNYFVDATGTIEREQANQYIPVFSTMLHFYTPRDKGFRWGGTFGAGIPISGDDKELNVLLGLSTFFGNNDPVCLTAGISGAQVKKLSGLSVGDKVTFTTLTDNNYTPVYRVGYFISLSFNPSALINKE